MLLTKSRKLWQRLSRREKPAVQLPNATAVPFHALHKSASMFLFKFFSELAERCDVGLYSSNHSPPNLKAFPNDVGSRFFVGPIRSFDCSGFEFEENHLKRIVQVRDPRDIIVSEYFSLGWLHTEQHWEDDARIRREQIQSVSIDEYALNQSQYNKYSLLERYEYVLPLLDNASTKVVKYETMVEHFPHWQKEVLDFIFEAPSPALHDYFCELYKDEFRPDSTPNGHKRKLTPGDHRQKLMPSTIAQLNQDYVEILSLLGYEL